LTADKIEITHKLSSFVLVFIHLILLKQHCVGLKAIFHNSTYNDGPNCVYEAVSVHTSTGSQLQIFHAFSLLPASHISVILSCKLKWVSATVAEFESHLPNAVTPSSKPRPQGTFRLVAQ
jgi:hypothetical protein